ncbi:hypothetical protein TRFO_29662 [Tritrichomonas foetus]|uniref:Uncharacterized protein n=1 Tax=Tritrichomonas foetus TaxID=1144522 RepID=A0A1J4K0M5_9EUKA|nr:hypothetical protein TRFO_29662 [Tritrichomonas foetus]|eukprot:OHT03045.1 hypothetical protein TRFO_29662 [Tritrichomonas foetus]
MQTSKQRVKYSGWGIRKIIIINPNSHEIMDSYPITEDITHTKKFARNKPRKSYYDELDQYNSSEINTIFEKNGRVPLPEINFLPDPKIRRISSPCQPQKSNNNNVDNPRSQNGESNSLNESNEFEAGDIDKSNSSKTNYNDFTEEIQSRVRFSDSHKSDFIESDIDFSNSGEENIDDYYFDALVSNSSPNGEDIDEIFEAPTAPRKRVFYTLPDIYQTRFPFKIEEKNDALISPNFDEILEYTLGSDHEFDNINDLLDKTIDISHGVIIIENNDA